jgi:hypothetical protein
LAKSTFTLTASSQRYEHIGVLVRSEPFDDTGENTREHSIIRGGRGAGAETQSFATKVERGSDPEATSAMRAWILKAMRGGRRTPRSRSSLEY